MAEKEKEVNGGRGTLNSARLRAATANARNSVTTARGGFYSASSDGAKGWDPRYDGGLVSARLLDRAGGDQADGDIGESERAPLILTARTTAATRRSHRPNSQASFDDARFVTVRPPQNPEVMPPQSHSHAFF